jgi:sugar O-acyltransferase (sialic acid O-acetyltransferase NeuD family)
MKPLYIFSFGGLSRENYGVAIRCGFDVKAFVEKNKPKNNSSYCGIPVLCEEELTNVESAVVSVGDPALKEKIVNNILKRFPNCEFPNLIDPSCIFLVPNSIKFGAGNVLHAWCLASADVTFGNFCQFGSGLVIGHDCVLEDYVIGGIAPSIAGNCKIGKSTRLGSNVATREGVSICNDVTLGVGAVVVKDITEPGIYVGNPAKRIK